jgi:hypothetical protein
MVKVDLRGIAKVTAKGRVYHYAWRGGPHLRGEPGSPEFMASYNEAIESRKTPDTGRFKSLVVLYRASNDYKKLANSTRKNWSPWLDRVSEYFGELRIAQFERPEKSGRPSVAGAISGPISLVLLIMGCRFYPASFPTR